ncbi:MAG: CHASE2 domain-containing protein [Steroidobacteraceae bacterium]
MPRDAVLERESIQPELLAGLAPEHLALVRWSGCGARYPLVLGANPGTVTPAFAAFRAACVADARWAPGCAANPRGAASDFTEPLRLRWGAFPPALQAFSSDARTCQPFANADGHVPLARRLGVALRELTLGLFEDLRDAPGVAVRLPCPAVPVVPLSLLERAPLEEWRELLRGRAVLIGASIAGIPDYVATPVHGQLPGVLLHAMALDNLARDGANYPADRHHEATEILAFVLVILFAFSFPRLLAVLERPAVRRSFAILGAIVWVVIVAACVQQGSLALAVSALLIAVCLDLAKPTQTATYFLAVIFAALAAGLTQSMGWTPGNWLGLTLLILGFGHMLKPFYHGSSASRLPGRYSLLGALWTRWRGVPAIAATAAPHGEPKDAPQSGAAPPPQGGH